MAPYLYNKCFFFILPLYHHWKILNVKELKPLTITCYENEHYRTVEQQQNLPGYVLLTVSMKFSSNPATIAPPTGTRKFLSVLWIKASTRPIRAACNTKQKSTTDSVSTHPSTVSNRLGLEGSNCSWMGQEGTGWGCKGLRRGWGEVEGCGEGSAPLLSLLSSFFPHSLCLFLS